MMEGTGSFSMAMQETSVLLLPPMAENFHGIQFDHECECQPSIPVLTWGDGPHMQALCCSLLEQTSWYAEGWEREKAWGGLSFTLDVLGFGPLELCHCFPEFR